MTSPRPSRARWIAAGGCGALGLWALAGPACGGGAPVDPNDALGGSGGAVASSSTTSSGTTTTTSGAGAGGTGNCPSAAIPEGVPDGWVEWTDWSCDCRMYVPGPEAALPPITWTACPDAPAGIDCEALATDWLDGLPGHFSAGQPGPGVDVDADGKATLLMYRPVPDHHTMFVVADADGPVHNAIMRLHPGLAGHSQTGCRLYGEDINEGRFLVLAKGANAAASEPSPDCGTLGGLLDTSSPTLVHHYGGDGTPSWRAGEKWVAWSIDSVFKAHPWDMSEEHFVASPATDPDGYKPTQSFVSGDAIFWTAASLYGGGLMVWGVTHGTREFVRWPGDHTRMAANLGTDGVDLVWSEGEGKLPTEPHTEFPIKRIMTAPFTADPDLLEPRRLRSQPGNVGQIWPWVVGCGFAAMEDKGQKLIVRLSDGWMWIVPTFSAFSRPVGVTCDHVILRANYPGQTNLVRIRLDSLGPGIEPD